MPASGRSVGQRHHAIVIGASMAGLLAARVLAERYATVTIVERDGLLKRNGKGVPQGRHAHGLLARGSRTLELLFPGIRDDIVDTSIWHNFCCTLMSGPSDIYGYLISRPTLEDIVRRRTTALDNVRVLARTEAIMPTYDARLGRVTGLTVKALDGGGETNIDADLLVDASGRGSRASNWLAELGFAQPKEEIVEVNISYMTRLYRRRPDHVPGKDAVIIAASAPDWRLGVMLAQDGDRWIVTLGGYQGDRAPSDDAGYLAFARGLQRREIYDVIKDAEPLSDPTPYGFPASRRRHYEQLTRFPEGFLVFGDALCSFNPIYGQGMSVASMEALTLRDCLENSGEGLWQRFFKSTAKVIDVPWQIAVGADLANPAVQGARPLPVRFINWYLARLHRAAQKDASLSIAFLQVANLLKSPPSIFAPRLAYLVWRGQTAAPELHHATSPRHATN